MFEYTLPFSETTILEYDNCCKLCLEEGRMKARDLQKGTFIYLDANNWYCCPRCYREYKRLGKIW